MDWGRFFFSAYGRIGRADFWILFFVLLGVTCLIGWIPFLGLVPLYCSICAKTKRLHDMGKSGWLQLIPIGGFVAASVFTAYFVVGAVISGTTGFAGAATGLLVGVGGLTLAFAWIMAFLFDLAFLLWIGLSEGQPFDNVYGPRRLNSGAGTPSYASP